MKTIIAGSRKFFSYNKVAEIIEDSGFEITLVISGCVKGVDVLGEQWARNHRVPVRMFSPQWKKCNGEGSRVRNKKIIDDAEALIAVYNSKTSVGTKDLIEQAIDKGLQIYLYDLLDGTTERR